VNNLEAWLNLRKDVLCYLRERLPQNISVAETTKEQDIDPLCLPGIVFQLSRLGNSDVIAFNHAVSLSQLDYCKINFKELIYLDILREFEKFDQVARSLKWGSDR
jgi:hypothetical protein